MAEEDIDLGRRILAKIRTECRKSGSSVDDEEALAASHLDAGRMPAKLHEAQA